MEFEQEKWVQLQRYVTGNASPSEQKKVEVWMEESGENRKMVQQLKTIWNEIPDEKFDLDVQYAWEQFQIRNQLKSESKNSEIGYSRRKSGMSVHILRAAAVLLVAAFAGLFVYYQMENKKQAESEQTAAFNVLQQLETGIGERARVTFSDGTSVTLNSASSVQFPQKFQGTTREVYLEGEAYFEVASDPDQPFIVNSQGARIEVLGTEFNVRGWSNDESVEVVVSEGEVSVQSLSVQPDERSRIILTEGFKTSLFRGENPSDPFEVDIVRHLLWTSGGMHFDNEPFRTVVRNLERRFNINITISDPSLAEIPYTGTFKYAQLNEVLEVLAVSIGVGFNRDGTEVEFHKQEL